MSERGRRKQVTGLVVSDRMDKTIAVEVDRLVKHDKYRKFVSRNSKFYAHDEKNEAGLGDTVEIAETRPLSKLKRWRLVRVIARAAGSEDRPSKVEAGEAS